MKVIDCGGQGTAAWFDERLGKLTSSRIAAAITKRKRRSKKEADPGAPLQAYLDLLLDLAVERHTKKPAEHFVSQWMEDGKDKEPLARASYQINKDVIVYAADFVRHESIECAGCSPDGLVGEDGLIEIKAPKRNTHAKYILGECVPEEYIPQMMWQLAVCGRKWNDFVSYHPDFSETNQELFVCRLHRDGQMIAVMEAEAEVFLKQVADLTLRLGHGLEGTLKESVKRFSIGQATYPPWQGETNEDLSCA